MIKAPKKLIEVALPLDDINTASAREKSIRHGHPSTLHLWWARRPLAAARAVLFAQLVNDPGGERGWGKYPGQTKEDAQKERERLFDIIRDLVKWENTTNETVLERARKEIRKSWRETCDMNRGRQGFDPDKLPAFHDPFAGGGAIPLEAQRLGLEAYASDLNPVAVMINKAMIEIPPKFAGRPPVNPDAQKGQTTFGDKDKWAGARGLADDVRYYGQWMRDEAFKRIGHLYPKVEVTTEMTQGRDDLKHMAGQKLTVIAWIWARTVKSPNPAFSHVDVPLVKSFVLSSKKGRETWLKPMVNGDRYHFEIKLDGLPEEAKEGTKSGRGSNFRCILSDTPIEGKYIKAQGKAGRMGQKLLAIVAEGRKGRIYLPATEEMEEIAASAQPEWKPSGAVPKKLTGGTCYGYGLDEWGKLFTNRQLVALNAFSDLVAEAREKVIADAKKAGWEDDGVGINDDGNGATAYGDAVAVYLAFAVDKGTDAWSKITGWTHQRETLRNTFARQAIPMVWDFAEANPFSSSSGNFGGCIQWIEKAFDYYHPGKNGFSQQADASTQSITLNKMVSTDPPYYDNIGYADLSDYFYVWMRRSLKAFFPDIFASILVPKNEELIASSSRHGSRKKAEQFFIDGMKRAVRNIYEKSSQMFPVTIYYAFKQNANIASTGWETFLNAVISSGFAITGTWPLNTERGGRTIGIQTNALASSIILVCRKRPENAPAISRREFLRELKETMPEALEIMIGGKGGRTPIQPADLAQAAIGPGMAVYSKYAGVLEADGSPMRVRDALIQINREIDAYFNAAEGELDADTRFCIDWFMQCGFKAGSFGEADVLARAKGTSVDGVDAAGVVVSGQGKVRLLAFTDYPDDWDPQKDKRNPVWESAHHLIRALRTGGEPAAGALLARMRERTEPIRQLAYRLFTLCERKNWAEEALAYNELISSWPRIVIESEKHGGTQEQMELF